MAELPPQLPTFEDYLNPSISLIANASTAFITQNFPIQSGISLPTPEISGSVYQPIHPLQPKPAGFNQLHATFPELGKSSQVVPNHNSDFSLHSQKKGQSSLSSFIMETPTFVGLGNGKVGVGIVKTNALIGGDRAFGVGTSW